MNQCKLSCVYAYVHTHLPSGLHMHRASCLPNGCYTSSDNACFTTQELQDYESQPVGSVPLAGALPDPMSFSGSSSQPQGSCMRDGVILLSNPNNLLCSQDSDFTDELESCISNSNRLMHDSDGLASQDGTFTSPDRLSASQPGNLTSRDRGILHNSHGLPKLDTDLTTDSSNVTHEDMELACRSSELISQQQQHLSSQPHSLLTYDSDAVCKSKLCFTQADDVTSQDCCVTGSSTSVTSGSSSVSSSSSNNVTSNSSSVSSSSSRFPSSSSNGSTNTSSSPTDDIISSLYNGINSITGNSCSLSRQSHNATPDSSSCNRQGSVLGNESSESSQLDSTLANGIAEGPSRIRAGRTAAGDRVEASQPDAEPVAILANLHLFSRYITRLMFCSVYSCLVASNAHNVSAY